MTHSHSTHPDTSFISFLCRTYGMKLRTAKKYQARFERYKDLWQKRGLDLHDYCLYLNKKEGSEC